MNYELLNIKNWDKNIDTSKNTDYIEIKEKTYRKILQKTDSITIDDDNNSFVNNCLILTNPTINEDIKVFDKDPSVPVRIYKLIFDNCSLKKEELKNNPKTWLLTGCAGFIGSNILKELLKLNQKVIGIDNFSNGSISNLLEIKAFDYKNFTLKSIDIRNLADLRRLFLDNEFDIVCHQAAIGSVPRSLDYPLDAHDNNVTGFVNVLELSKEFCIKNFVYASSSSVYGESDDKIKTEGQEGKIISPYAATKCINEIYAKIYEECYDYKSIGLRYFNVFGPLQEKDSNYSTVIPKWINKILNKETLHIYGDGSISRDFCYVDNVVNANILSATTDIKENKIYNVGCNGSNSLNDLYDKLENIAKQYGGMKMNKDYTNPRSGDVSATLANIDRISEELKYEPEILIDEGLENTFKYYYTKKYKEINNGF